MAVVKCLLFLARLPERHHVIYLNVRDNNAYDGRSGFFKNNIGFYLNCYTLNKCTHELERG